ncbi:MAG: hypothetical protein RSF00_07495, partial [Oscillospiraceae bacterium]
YYMDMLRSTRSIYTCSILLALCFAAWICAMMLYEKFKKYKKAIDIVLLLATIGIAIYTSWLFICYNYSSNGSFQEHHANAYFYPVYKVYSGQTMLVDFKNIYGFYPYFLMPFFKLLGSCSEYNFSLVMSWLMFIGSMCIIYTLFSACKNRVIACMCSIATLFAAGVYALNNNGAGYYLQYFPQRYLFPAIILAICSLRLRVKNATAKKLTDLLAFFIVAIALLWNLDSGLVVWVAWSAFRIYILLFENPLTNKSVYKKIGLVVLSAAFQVIFAFGFLGVITFARTGVWPNLLDALFGQSVFMSAGFFMLPMHFLHIWLLLVSLYGFALIKSIRNLRFMRKSDADLDISYCARYFVMAIIGMGLFAYYQGRSHNDVFTTLMWNGILLLSIFIDEYACHVKQSASLPKEKRLWQVKLCCSGALVLLFAAFYLFDIVDPRMLSVEKEKPIKTNKTTELYRDFPIIEKIRDDEGEMPDLIYNASAFAYSRLDEKMTAHMPERCDWFTFDECKAVVDYLSTSEKSFVIDKQSMDLILRKYPQITETITKSYVFNGRLENLLWFKYDANKIHDKNELNTLLWLESAPLCIIAKAEDGRPWAFDNVQCDFIYSNLNSVPVKVLFSADLFPSKTGDYSLTVKVSTGEKDVMSFKKGSVSYSKEFVLQPGVTTLTFTSNAPRFDSGDGYARFGIENIKTTILTD